MRACAPLHVRLPTPTCSVVLCLPGCAGSTSFKGVPRLWTTNVRARAVKCSRARRSQHPTIYTDCGDRVKARQGSSRVDCFVACSRLGTRKFITNALAFYYLLPPPHWTFSLQYFDWRIADHRPTAFRPDFVRQSSAQLNNTLRHRRPRKLFGPRLYTPALGSCTLRHHRWAVRDTAERQHSEIPTL